MKIAVVGAGAIGGYLAVKLAQIGHEVSVVIRGANLQAVRENGMKLIMDDGSEHVAQLYATDRVADLPVQDIVILGMKAHQVAAVAADIPALLGPESIVVTAQNGVPWWYFHKHGGAYEGRRVEAVDPGGAISAHIDVARVIGCIVYPACEIVAPGVIQHIEGNRFSLGEIDGSDTPRIHMLADVLRQAGFKAPVSSDIRSELWVKLWGNLSFNPISALTHATLVDICEFSPTRELVARMMREGQTIGEKLGVNFKVTLDRRIAGAAAVGKHKTSMLQDIEAGRPIELEALVGTVIEMGRITDTPTPNIEAVYALAALLARTVQEQHGKLRIQA
ncbi:2-dehydropantoate 2-reductase [Undibacterium sp. TS12]|uniref:2-dehydropantoate 2-reductase n=1 Tax=Undibacterium sp. TS12 TaxID=2908202 RepID=UPI001F4CA9BA|nr:2-dehydropantoate 2-reductase [Undibacterium sp. TS12]MCH8620236.1 2-dehydropantoate 2-reductase [Undibacterium sp. TS12]